MGEVLMMKPTPTWEDLRDEYSKLEQMGWQAVLQGRRVGDVLTALREQCTDQKEFVQRVGQAIGIGKSHAFNLMGIAANWPLMEQHHPEGIRAALALIPRKKPTPAAPAYRRSRNVLLEEQLGRKYRTVTNLVKKNPDVFRDQPTVFTDEGAALAFVEWVKEQLDIEEKQPTREELNATQQRKLDIAWRAQKKQLDREYEAAVEREVAKRTESYKEHWRKLQDEAKEREAQLSAAMATVESFMSESEYRLLLNCLHPDRAPEERRERFATAFNIVRRLEAHVNRSLPLAVLRERGWTR